MEGKFTSKQALLKLNGGKSWMKKHKNVSKGGGEMKREVNDLEKSEKEEIDN